jgi:hypothetical protein
MKDKDITPVVFRQFSGEIVALFPYEAWDIHDGRYCASYAHIGQHSAADYGYVVNKSIPAQPEQYADLKSELEGIGYSLKVLKRVSVKKRYS